MSAVPVSWSRNQRLALLLATAAVGGNCGKGDDVTGPPGSPSVASVEVAPNPVNLSIGQQLQLIATVKAADGTVLSGRAVVWETSDPAIAGVEENGMLTGAAEGEATVTATSEGQSGSATVTVAAAPVASVEVVPHPSSVLLGQTAQLTAIVRGPSGEELSGRAVTWSSSDVAIATVTESGVVTGVAIGAATITATSEGQVGSSDLTVSSVPVSTVEVSPPTASIGVSGTVQLSATAKDAAGAVLTGRPAVWTSSDANIARVNAVGRVSGLAAGSATIVATIEGRTGSATVTVTQQPTQQPVATVELSPNLLLQVPVGGTLQFTAIVKAADGTVLTGRSVSWTSSNNAVATVSASGLATGLAPGNTVITASSEGKSDTGELVVVSAAGVERTWRGGISPRPQDWSTPGNWVPAGKPFAQDLVLIPSRPDPAMLSEDVQVARLSITGGTLRVAGHRLRIAARQIPTLVAK